MAIKQRLAHCDPLAESSLWPVFVKFYWDTVMPVYLCLVSGHFAIGTMADQSSCDRNLWSAKLKIFTIWPITDKAALP